MLTRRAVRGIRRVSDAATDISRGQLSRRVNAVGQVSEVQTLADTFDAMADRIQSLIRNMREMTDNIAHDLRSPLARIRILAETSMNQSTQMKNMKRIAENTIVECDRLTQMINTSLDVAETEAGVARVQHETLEIHAVIEDVCELYHPLADQNNIQFDYQLQGDCTLTGDATSIQRMFSNILDNAIKYTPSGGCITVTLQCLPDHVDILVSDNGPGIEKEHQGNIFNRFFRVDQSRTNTGTGLGLSYARAVARSHGGDITVSSEPHKKTVFEINLPRKFKPSEIVSPRAVAV
jgi:signal transduction histidine kinase